MIKRTNQLNLSSVPKKRMNRSHIQMAAQDWMVQKYGSDREESSTLYTLTMIRVGVIRLSNLVVFLKYSHPVLFIELISRETR